jgi:hypothetical protein
MLMACGLAVLLSIDVLAFGLRRPADRPAAARHPQRAGEHPADALALPVFVGTALLFLRLMATENSTRSAGGDLGWGPSEPRPSLADDVVAGLDHRGGRRTPGRPLIPVTDLLDRNGGGSGNNAVPWASSSASVNPFVRLHRDLVEQTHTPLLYAKTDARSTSYIRTTVLDRFTGEEWRPSSRDLPGANTADGVFPRPPAWRPLSEASRHMVLPVRVQLHQHLAATALPDPQARRPGSWRYDSKTLDVAYVGGVPRPS